MATHDPGAGGPFVRDTAFGGILHPRAVSFRELRPVDSAHVCIRGTRVTAHVDRFSPLNVRGGLLRYSPLGVLAHYVEDVLGRALRRLTGRAANDTCHLDCDIVWVDDDEDAA
jgi:hypothetical protein